MAYGPISVKAKEMWSKFGLVDVRAFGEGFFFFSFETKEGMKKVLDYKQWKMYQKPVYLKKWSLDFDDNKESYKCVQVLVKISGIPSHSWNHKSINDVASKIGVPILLDEVTDFSPYAFFARVLVEKPVNSEFPLHIEMFTEKNVPFMVTFEYSWRPGMCVHCKGFGHNTYMCPKYKGKEKVNQDFTQ